MEWKEIKSGEIWKEIKKDDSIEGILIQKTEGQFGDNYEIETKEGIITLPTLTVLNNKMRKVPVGNKVRVEYLGEITSKKGSVYKDFAVFHAPNWSKT